MRGWLTTEALTGNYVCRRFSIPVELLSIFMGALDRTTFPSNYEQFGTLTPDDMSTAFQEVMSTYTTSEGDCETLAQIGVIELRTTPPDPDTGDSVLCDGAAYLKSDYPDYWQMIVNTGHEAQWELSATQFSVPDILDRFIRGADNQPGAVDGANEVTLSVANMPAHTHTEEGIGLTGLAVEPGELPAVISGAPKISGSTGSGTAFGILPEYVQLYPYIRLRGNVSIPTPPTVNSAGEIVPYYGTTLPDYTLACDGATYLKATYPLLWAVLETEVDLLGAKVFQVDANNFKVPDFRGRALIGLGHGPGLTDRPSPVSNYGSETHQLTANEMPVHSHTEEGIDVGTSSYQGGTNRTAFVITSQQSGTAGSGLPHNNMQPSRAVRLAIRYA